MSTTRRTRVASLLLAAVMVAPTLGAQPSAGDRDDFEDGTTQGWVVGGGIPGIGHPAPPQVLPDGRLGPLDHFLRLTSLGGNGAGSRMSALNFSQWTGDWLASGWSGIGMWARNSGPDDLYLRLLFGSFGAEPGPPLHIASSLDAIHLPAGSGWQWINFPIVPSALGGSPFGTVEGALSNTTELRIFHNPDFGFAGPQNSSPPVIGTLDIDNVTATPEPGTILLVGTGVAALVARRRRKRES